MKKIFAIIITETMRCFSRHGRRCLNTLGGVFSKKILLLLITAGMLLLTTCSEGLLGSMDKLREKAAAENSGGKIYTVTFDINGATAGETPPSQTAKGGSTVTLPGKGDLERNDDTFGGWNTLADGSGQNYDSGSSYKVSGDVTLFARWISPTNTITYNGNGNTSGAVPAPKTVNAGDSYELPDQGTLLRAGYTFDGWDTQIDGKGGKITSPYTPAASRTLYARWVCTISFDRNSVNGTGSVPPITGAIADSIITLPDGTGLSSPGTNFAGWNTQANGNGTPYSPGASYPVTGLATLYAQWAQVFIVTYYGNGNTGGTVPAAQSGAPQTYITIPAEVPTRTNYTFGGWCVNQNGQGQIYNPGASVHLTGNIPLYAKWDCTVSYNLNGGSGAAPASVTVTAGQSVQVPSGTYTKEGFTFSGWNTNNSGTGTNYNAGDSFTPDGHTTLYALWYNTMDIEDFASPTPVIAGTFSVNSEATWNTALASIQSGGNDKNYVINLTGNFTLAGIPITTYSFLVLFIAFSKIFSLLSQDSIVPIYLSFGLVDNSIL